MAASTCVKCGNTEFEMQETTLNGSDFKFMFVQCVSCGGVVGVLDYYNIGSLIQDFAQKMNVSLE